MAAIFKKRPLGFDPPTNRFNKEFILESVAISLNVSAVASLSSKSLNILLPSSVPASPLHNNEVEILIYSALSRYLIQLTVQLFHLKLFVASCEAFPWLLLDDILFEWDELMPDQYLRKTAENKSVSDEAYCAD